jgi:hypothetical protein
MWYVIPATSNILKRQSAYETHILVSQEEFSNSMLCCATLEKEKQNILELFNSL